MKTIYLSGVVGYEITADAIRRQINEKSTEKLQVIVNSPGGFVVDAFEIFNLFKSYKGGVEFVINGMAASAMSYIIMSGNKISAFKNSIFMAHRVQGIGFGDADAIQREAEIARAMDNVIAEAYTARIKKSKEDILADMKNEIWLIGWEQLTDGGIIDNVIDSPEEIEIPDDEIKKQIDEANSINQQTAQLAISACRNRMQNDADRVKENSAKAAALLTIEKESKQNQLPATGEDKSTKEGHEMTLQDFLKSNPEAQAEYDKALEAARAEGAGPVNSDRERIASILKYSNVKLTGEAINAIVSGQDAKDFAAEELERERKLRDENKGKESPFSALRADQTPGEQDPAGKKEAQNQADADAEFDAKIEASAKKYAKEVK